jgi:hypothetical protein
MLHYGPVLITWNTLVFHHSWSYCFCFLKWKEVQPYCVPVSQQLHRVVLFRTLYSSFCFPYVPVITKTSLLIILMMEAASTCKMSVNFYHTTWHNIIEDSHLHVLIVRQMSITFSCSLIGAKVIFVCVGGGGGYFFVVLENAFGRNCSD